TPYVFLLSLHDALPISSWIFVSQVGYKLLRTAGNVNCQSCQSGVIYKLLAEIYRETTYQSLGGRGDHTVFLFQTISYKVSEFCHRLILMVTINIFVLFDLLQ